MSIVSKKDVMTTRAYRTNLVYRGELPNVIKGPRVLVPADKVELLPAFAEDVPLEVYQEWLLKKQFQVPDEYQ